MKSPDNNISLSGSLYLSPVAAEVESTGTSSNNINSTGRIKAVNVPSFSQSKAFMSTRENLMFIIATGSESEAT